MWEDIEVDGRVAVAVFIVASSLPVASWFCCLTLLHPNCKYNLLANVRHCFHRGRPDA